MRVKRYIVDTMPEAMQFIRNELGNDAVILSSKEVKIGGFMGIFTKKKIEVIAAVDKEDKPKPDNAGVPGVHVPRKLIPQAYKKTVDSQTSGQKNKEVRDHLKNEPAPPQGPSNREQAAADFAAAFAQAVAGSGNNQSTAPQEQAPSNSHEREQGDAVMPASVSDNKPPMLSVSKSEAEQKVLDELREMKEWIARLSRHNTANRELPAPLESIRDQFSKQDLSVQLAERWIDTAADEWAASGMSLTEEELKASIRGQIDSFLKERFGGGIQRGTRIVYIAGPTGVGKTTTIAKLAAEQLFRYQRKVGFITSDTYRISAVEQLRTYASILNVPLEVVQSPGDMQRALHRLEACDLILMDTAGRNYRNELLVSELQSLMTPSDQSETYLVLSLTSKSSDMVEITDHFSKFGLDKVILTKLDETGSCGPLFNLLEAHPLKLSYMTNGQNVPDDLLMPDTKMLSGMLLGEMWS